MEEKDWSAAEGRVRRRLSRRLIFESLFILAFSCEPCVLKGFSLLCLLKALLDVDPFGIYAAVMTSVATRLTLSTRVH